MIGQMQDEVSQKQKDVMKLKQWITA